MLRFAGPIFVDSKPAQAGAGQNHGAKDIDPDALVKAHKAKGYTAAYAPQLDINDGATIKKFREAFEKHDILIAEVGFWDNMIDLDQERRDKNRKEMVEALALAEELGACCAVNTFGSYRYGMGSQHSARNFSDEAFDEAVTMARSFIDEVKPKTASFAYEIFPFNVVDSPEMIEKLIKAVDRKQFGVHLDLVNLIKSPRDYWNSGEIMKDCIRRFGDRIVAAHAKDIKMKEPSVSVILEEVMPGTGNIDGATLLNELHKLPQTVPLMMEHLANEAEFDQAAAWWRQVGASQNIKL